jgi:Uma2 family endonuclease
MPITAFSQLDLTKQYTYADYLAWEIEERLELIKGWIMRMAAPGRAHQYASWRLSRYIDRYFEYMPCEAYAAPTEVRFLDQTKTFKTNKDIYTVVQPDIFMVCDVANKMRGNGCLGAPDLVIEILSPGNTKREMKQKYEVYEENGVREYWIVHPSDKFVIIHWLNENGVFNTSKYFTEDDILKSVVFEGLEINLSQVFLNENE